MKLSLAVLKNMKERSFVHFDDGLDAYKATTGVIKFRQRYTFEGKRKYAPICKFDPKNNNESMDDLKGAIRRVRSEIHLGKDPQAERLKRAAEAEIERVRVVNQRTMGEVAEEWLECAVMKGEGRKPPRQN